MRDYHINIRIGRSSTRQGEGCEWECPYCKGTGKDPYGIMGTERCPACHGSGWWKADVSYAIAL